MKFQKVEKDFNNPKHREEWLMVFFTSITQRNRSKLHAKAESVCRWIDMGGSLTFYVTTTVDNRPDVTYYHIVSPLTGGNIND